MAVEPRVESGQPFARPLASAQSTSARQSRRAPPGQVSGGTHRRDPRRDAPPAPVLRAKVARRVRAAVSGGTREDLNPPEPLRARGLLRHSIVLSTDGGPMRLSNFHVLPAVALGRCLVLMKFSGCNCRPSNARSENRRNLSALEQLSAGSADGLQRAGEAVRYSLDRAQYRVVTASDDGSATFASRSSTVHAAGRL
jgi:hypothetical protein